MAQSRRLLRATPSPDEIVKLHDKNLNDQAIATRLGCSVRHVREVLRVEEHGVAELKRRIRKPRNAGGIIPRAAARLAAYETKVQRRIVRKLIGEEFMTANQIIQAEERRIGKVNRGRRPTRVPLDDHVRRRCDELLKAILDRLAPKQKGKANRRVDPRVLAHAEVLLIVSGRKNVEDLYQPTGELAKIIDASDVRRLVRRRPQRR